MPDLITTTVLTANATAAGGTILATVTNAAPILATIVSTGSQVVQRFCGNRDFVRTTYTEEYTPALDGRVRLNQMPVNRIIKVEGELDTALSITCDPTQATSAWVVFTITGDWATGLTVTGLQLSRVPVSTGVEVDSTLLFATYPTIGQLQAAINALGGGWSTPSPSGYASWPSTALVGAITAQGAMQEGAQLSVFSQVLPGCGMEDQATGMLSTGRRNVGGISGPRWGPDWAVFDDYPLSQCGRVRVTYDAGFTTVPLEVQQATVEVCFDLLYLLSLDQRLMSESDGAYSYTQKLKEAAAAYDMPTSAAGKLARWIIHNA